MMLECLTFGVTKKGDWIFIDEFGRGQPSLYCPFCKGGLVAKQGLTKYHHFVHEEDSCTQMLAALNVCQLPTIDTFELLDEQELRYLADREKQQHHDIPPWVGMVDTILRLSAMGIVDVDSEIDPVISQVTKQLKQVDAEFFTGQEQPSEKLMVLLAAFEPLASLQKHWEGTGKVTATKINDAYYTNSLLEQISFKKLDQAQRYWLDAFCKRQHHLFPEYQSFLSETLTALNRRCLYVMEVTGNFPNCPRRFLKIGMTTRHINFQLTQVKADLDKLGSLESVKLLATVIGAGRLEKLIQKQFLKQRIQLGEHLAFFSEAVKGSLLDELGSIANIENYFPPVFEYTPITNSPGRQKKTVSQLLAEYPEVVSALNAHQMSVRKACKETGRASATVQKVKKAMQL